MTCYATCIICATHRPPLFTGKERDAESGNDYFGARYYASTMGRFLSPDWGAKEEPVPYARLDDPQSLNLYSYVRNSPLLRTDPDGHQDPDCGCQQITDQQVINAFNQASLWLLNNTIEGAVGIFKTVTTGHNITQQEIENIENNRPVDAPATTQAPAPAPATGEKQPLPLVGNHPKEAGTRTNTDLPGGHEAAK
jgi:RHS repeat-associated protein